MILDKLLLVAYLAYYQNNFYNMFNIVLISTEHREFGNCNSDELCKILESINPDVIFEEEPNDVNIIVIIEGKVLSNHSKFKL